MIFKKLTTATNKLREYKREYILYHLAKAKVLCILRLYIRF